MSIDVNVTVYGKKTKKEVMDYLLKKKAIVKKKRGESWDFFCAGFGFDFWTNDADDIKEAKENGYYRPGMEDEVILHNSTNMGWSYHGDTRNMQFQIAHMLAQELAMGLNTVTAVKDPQTDKGVYYRRFDHPEVHAILDGTKDSFAGDDYENFCETCGEENNSPDGQWEQLGWQRRRKYGIKTQGII